MEQNVQEAPSAQMDHVLSVVVLPLAQIALSPTDVVVLPFQV
jgi:hypothetical protein